MKRILITISVTVFALLAIYVIAQDITEVIVTNSSTTVPKEILDGSSNILSAKTFIFIGMSAAHTTNTSRIIIQRNPTNNVGGIPISPGEKVGIPIFTDRPRPVRWWVDVESVNDGVIVIPIQ